MKKTLVLIAAFLFSSVSLIAQEAERLDFNLDLKSNHLWRGITVTDAPMAAVDINYALDKNKHLKLGIWGGMGFSDVKDVHYTEINYYINYSKNRFSIGIWDVFNSSGRAKGAKDNEIFRYDREATGHRFDLRASYIFSESFPLKIEGGPSFYGDDRKLNGDQRFSTYAELSYPVIRNHKVNLNAFVGSAFALNGGESHFYGNGKNDFDIVNVGITASKDIPVLGYKLPVSATAMWNPSVKEARVQIAASLF